MILAKITPVTQHYDNPREALMGFIIFLLIIAGIILLLRFITRNWL
jgi:hypothetical protein